MARTAVKCRRTLGEYAEMFPYCQACGIPAASAFSIRWPGLEIHHLVRMGRSDERCNLLRLCKRCHDALHVGVVKNFPPLSFAILLSVKKLRDPLGWNPARLKALYVKNLPDLLPVPEVLLEEWYAWQRRR